MAFLHPFREMKRSLEDFAATGLVCSNAVVYAFLFETYCVLSLNFVYPDSVWFEITVLVIFSRSCF